MSRQPKNNSEEPRTLLRNNDAPRQEYIPGVRSREQTLMMQGRKPTDPTTEYRNQSFPISASPPWKRSRTIPSWYPLTKTTIKCSGLWATCC